MHAFHSTKTVTTCRWNFLSTRKILQVQIRFEYGITDLQAPVAYAMRTAHAGRVLSPEAAQSDEVIASWWP
jgi:hypothetical protein